MEIWKFSCFNADHSYIFKIFKFLREINILIPHNISTNQSISFHRLYFVPDDEWHREPTYFSFHHGNYLYWIVESLKHSNAFGA